MATIKKQMIKRADGSYSQRGLWDNIRANKGSGKKPTTEMLKQEKKIKKAQKGIKATPDSSSIYTRRMLSDMDMADRSKGELKTIFTKKWKQDASDLERQKLKGKPGYDANGFSLKKNKLGGTIKKARTGAWQRKEGKSPSGGLNAKGRASLKAEGHNIKPPQPEGGPRKKSFCSRMSGMKKKLTSAKTANDPNSRINKSLRKWKC